MTQFTTILIRAEDVVSRDNGTYAVQIETRALTSAERETINRLFPNTAELVHDLLDREALLGAIVR